ncbi:Expansin-A23-like protein [Drosera capensis]
MANSSLMVGYFTFMAIVLLASGQYQDARATFYGDASGGGTEGGACGYYKDYGVQTAALSTALFQDGAACGSCYEIYCTNSQFCKNGKSIRITATNFCPPNYTKSHDIWCNPPQKHFDLTQPMFLQIAEYRAGVVPVKFRRISCSARGGIRLRIAKANNNWILVLVYNVAGAGTISGVKIKGNDGIWRQMTRNWGVNYQTGGNWYGQSMSFQITATDGRTIEVDYVVPGSWQVGQSFQGKTNF